MLKSMLCTGVLKIGELAAMSNACNMAMKENAIKRSILLAKRQTRQRGKLSTKAN